MMVDGGSDAASSLEKRVTPDGTLGDGLKVFKDSFNAYQGDKKDQVKVCIIMENILYLMTGTLLIPFAFKDFSAKEKIFLSNIIFK